MYKIPIEFEVEKSTEESILDSFVDLSIPADKPSIAVLPFVNMSGDPEQEYFSDGITEEIITALSKVPDLLVIARNSTFVYKGKPVDIKQIGKELGVKYVLEGSVRKVGNQIRLTAQLIDSTNGSHIWADRYDRELKEIFKLQDELTIRILEELSIRLHHNERARLITKGTDSLEAYLKWWQGLEYIYNFNMNGNIQAHRIGLEMIRLDPNWGTAYAFLSQVRIMDFWGGWSKSREQCLQEAMEYSQKAISLDDKLPEPYVVLCQVYLSKRNFDEALNEAEKAIIVQPNYFLGYQLLGLALTCAGNNKKAEEILKKAMRFNPKHFIIKLILAMTYINSGVYAQAITLVKSILKENPDNFFAQINLTACYCLAGMKEEAHNQAQEILRIDPNFTVDNFAILMIPYENQSDTDRILNALRKAGLK